MNTIASFQINHDTLEKGMYISRIDGDIVTYDLRMKKPNQGDYLENAAIHTFEHLFATFARNSHWSANVIYIGPMGCRTGFYLLLRDRLTHEDALSLTKAALNYIRTYEGEIPGTKPAECGNYQDHDLPGAKAAATDFQSVLATWSPSQMTYAD